MRERIDPAEGRALFGSDPRSYDQGRPRYPAWIFEKLSKAGLLSPSSRLLEVGPGSGLATRQLLAQGVGRVTLIEPDGRFRAMLQDAVDSQAAPGEIRIEAFEDSELPDDAFDLAVAATCFHWLDPVPALRKLRRVLCDGGAVALIWNVLQDLDKRDLFHEATTHVLSSLAVSPGGTPNALPFGLDRAAREADARAAGFTVVDYTETRWPFEIDAEGVVRLYGGFSQIQRLEPLARARVLAQLREIAESEFGGRVIRNVTSCLYTIR